MVLCFALLFQNICAESREPRVPRHKLGDVSLFEQSLTALAAPQRKLAFRPKVRSTNPSNDDGNSSPARSSRAHDTQSVTRMYGP